MCVLLIPSGRRKTKPLVATLEKYMKCNGWKGRAENVKMG